MSKEILQVHMFGEFSLTYGDQKLTYNNRSRLIWNILAYLLCHRGEFISSDTLISTVWKNEKNDNSAGAMRTAIHRARTLLSQLTQDSECKFLIAQNGGYMWNPEIELVLDCDLFEEKINALKNGTAGDEIELCRSAIALYNDKFLSNLSAELWVIPLQTYYHNLYETLMDILMPALVQAGRYSEGVFLCKNALMIDPYAEKTYQYLMRFLLLLGEYQEALSFYEELSKLLLSTFDVSPDPDSKALYLEALSSSSGTAVSPETILEQLNEPGEICGALVCEYDFFKKLYHTQARTIVRSGLVIHTVLLTLRNRGKRAVAARSISLAMDNLETHLSLSLRKGDVITRCSNSQFIIMLPSCNYEDSCKVCQRFISAFERKYPHSPVFVDYFVQALRPSTRS